MRIYKLFPMALLMVTLVTSGAAYPNDSYSDSPESTKESRDDHRHTEKLWTKLPEEKRKLLHDAMTQAHKQNELLREAIKKQGKELDALLAAPNFDKDTYLDKSAKLGELHARMKANMSDAFATAMEKFTPEERKTLAKLREMRHHHHCQGDWHHDKHPKEWSHHGGAPDHKPQAE